MRRYVDDVYLYVDAEIEYTMPRGEKSKSLDELRASGALAQAARKTTWIRT